MLRWGEALTEDGLMKDRICMACWLHARHGCAASGRIGVDFSEGKSLGQ